MIAPLRRAPFNGVVLILGLHGVYMGFALGREWMIGQGRFALPWAASLFCLVAGVACLWFHRHPTDRQWWAWSGALLGGAYVWRGLLIIQAALLEEWSYKYMIGAATWIAWAGVVTQLWLHQFRPKTQ